ncbi:MAG: hypothetical protein LBB78_03815 [Spirochaetaceae bacterium]|jgi:hypothetical protein|nr:hypothetical protein [Spirochaetaceae bacterium]
MKKKQFGFFGIAVLVAAAMFITAGCDTGSGGGGGSGTTVTYTGTASGTTYTLTITKNTSKAAYTPQAGDSYVLTIGGQKSSGTVQSVSGGTFTLKPASGSTFTATVSGSGITGINGTIALDGGGTVPAPGTMTGGGGDDDSSDDDDSSGGGNFTGGYTPQNLNNTVWKATGYSLTFTSTTEYLLEEIGGPKHPGTYTVSGTAITLTDSSGGSPVTGTFSGNTLVTSNGYIFTYQRRR